MEYIKQCFKNKEKVSDSINSSLMKYFKEYLCVGGMPDAVNTFFKTNDLNQVRDIQLGILEQYKNDFGKHLDENENYMINKNELIKIMEVYSSIPNQLARENKKFQYSVINKNAKGREYRNAITWLEEFGLVNLCHNLKSLELPLDGNKEENIFKIYVADSGLFVAMLEKGTANNILNGDLKIYKGAIFENIVAEALAKMGKKLYYFSKSSGLKIDFITKLNNKLTLLEVKAKNGNTKSLKEILENKTKYDVNSAIKFIDGNVGYSNHVFTIPLYMVFLID